MVRSIKFNGLAQLGIVIKTAVLFILSEQILEIHVMMMMMMMMIMIIRVMIKMTLLVRLCC